MIKTANLGYPRFGAKRELKQALESFWKGKSSQDDFLRVCYELRRQNWKLQQDAEIDFIPSNDFSAYDQVLDMIATVGAVPERYKWAGENVDLETYFAMARGSQSASGDTPAMEMTKWFDTNYHYIVPEFESGQTFKLASTKIIDEFKEAVELGIKTRPVLLGPVSFLILGKSMAEGFSQLDLLNALLPVYQLILKKLSEARAEWVQIDEPCLVLDLNKEEAAAYKQAYRKLANPNYPKLMLTTYFGDLRDNLPLVAELPVAGLHIDLVRSPGQIDEVLKLLPVSMLLSLGLLDGRNVWRADLDAALLKIKRAIQTLGEDRVIFAPSCSLLFCPYDLDLETGLDAELQSWLAFAKQKIEELKRLKGAANSGSNAGLLENRKAIDSRRNSERTHNTAVRKRLAEITSAMLQRTSPHEKRKAIQAKSITLPPFPTTTIGSFPQTQEVRAQRAAFRKGNINQQEYDEFLRAETERTIRFQEEIGLDVLVHGEFERTDMVDRKSVV